jgi:hypothetical protein
MTLKRMAKEENDERKNRRNKGSRIRGRGREVVREKLNKMNEKEAENNDE